MFKRIITALVTVTLLTGCSQLEPDAQPQPVDYMGCVLSDNFGFDDQSVGSLSFLGALQAQAQYGIKLRSTAVPANATAADYSTALTKLMKYDCDIVVAVGGASEVVENNSANYKKTNFIEVHGRPYSVGQASGLSPAELTNVKSLSYDSAQGGFLAGYLAATQTKTNVVAGFAATLNRAELAMLSGFSQGVAYANATNKTSVQLLGQATALSDYWLTIGQSNSEEAQNLFNRFVAEGADVILPVVGGTQQAGSGFSVTSLAAQSAGKVSVVGSFSDWYDNDNATDVRSAVLGSVVLSIQSDVAAAIGTDLAGTFTGGLAGEYLGNLSNQGVNLVGPHDQPFNINFINTVDALRNAIASGEIVVSSKLQ